MVCQTTCVEKSARVLSGTLNCEAMPGGKAFGTLESSSIGRAVAAAFGYGFDPRLSSAFCFYFGFQCFRELQMFPVFSEGCQSGLMERS